MAVFTRSGVHAPQAPSLTGAFFRDNGHTEAPIVLQCYLTLRCPLSCAHCLATPAGPGVPDMPVGTFDRLCAEAAAMGIPEILLTGGEPLAHPDLGTIVASLRRLGLRWSLNTACCPTPSQKSVLTAHPPGYVAVSLDGPASVHDAFRGRRGSHADAMQSLRWFASLGPTTVCAGTTITTRNLDHLDATFDLVRASGAHRWGIHLLLPEGRAGDNHSLFPTTRQMRGLLADIVRMRKSFPVSLCDEMGFAGEWEALVRDEGFFCAAGRAMCAVLPDGSVMPCSTLDPRHCEGNLNGNSLAEIWRTGFAAQRAQHRDGKCARCKDWAVCGSGCWLQRIHGTQCFRHLWKVPEPLRAAAGIALCVGSLQGTGSRAGETDATSGTATSPGVAIKPAAPLVVRGVYGSKAGPRLEWRALTTGPLNWLDHVANRDSTWGTPERRVELTSLSVLCLVECGRLAVFEAPAPPALRFLHARVQQPPARNEQDAILAWCLTEVYRSSRLTDAGQVARKALDRMTATRPSPWSVLAWEAAAGAFTSEADLGWIRKSLARARPPDGGLVAETANRLSKVLLSDTHNAGAVDDPLLARLQDWRGADRPFLTALMASRLHAALGEEVWNSWHTVLDRHLLRTRRTEDALAWWDAASVGAAGNAETSGMAAGDAEIYCTTMVLLSAPYRRRPSSLLPGARAEDGPTMDPKAGAP